MFDDSMWLWKMVIDAAFTAGKRAAYLEMQAWVLDEEHSRSCLITLGNHIPFAKLKEHCKNCVANAHL